jgi:uncharacterized protein YdeI (BOF family)
MSLRGGYFMKSGMFLIFLMAVILTATGCSAEKYGLGIDSSAPVVKVKDIILRPDFVGRTVTLEGKIISQCQSNGCWFFLYDETGQIFINLKPNNFALPSRIGKNVRVTGIVSADQQGYQIIARGVEIK